MGGARHAQTSLFGGPRIEPNLDGMRKAVNGVQRERVCPRPELREAFLWLYDGIIEFGAEGKQERRVLLSGVPPPPSPPPGNLQITEGVETLRAV